MTIPWLAILLLPALGPGAMADDPLPVDITLLPGPRAIGSTITVEVSLGEERQISAMQFALEYDPTILEPAGAAPWIRGDVARPLIELYNRNVETGAEPDPHRAATGVSYGDLTRMRSHGPGLVASVRFTVIATGSSPLKFPPSWAGWNPNPKIINDSSAVYPVVAPDSVFTNRAGAVLRAEGGLTTHESGGRAFFSIALETAPSADVAIPLSCSEPTEASVSPTQIVFTPSNWFVPQWIAVRGGDDGVVDGDVPYWVVTDPAVSDDTAYKGFDAPDMPAVNLDNDVPAVLVAPTSPPTTSEDGRSVTFEVVLTVRPTADATVPLAISQDKEGRISKSGLLFTSEQWSEPQRVVVTGLDDSLVDGTVSYPLLIGPVTSDDVKVSGLDPADPWIENLDDEDSGVRVEAASPVEVVEGGETRFTLVLERPPAHDVVVAVSSPEPGSVTVTPSFVRFKPGTWTEGQVVSVTAVDDSLDDDDAAFRIEIGPVWSVDPSFNGRDIPDLRGTAIDNDVSGFIVTPTTGLLTSEAGGTATFTVRLTCQPADPVTIPLSTSNAAEGLVSPAILLLDDTNWSVPQTVTVRGVDDTIDDGDVAYSIVIDNVGGKDSKFKEIDPPDVSLVNRGNDSDLELTVSATALSPMEGEEVDLLLRLRNLGNSDARDVAVAAPIPAGLEFRSVTGSGAYDAGNGLWTVGELTSLAEASLQIVVRVRVGPAGDPVSVGASIASSDQADPDPSNDAVILVLDPPSPEVNPPAGNDSPGGCVASGQGGTLGRTAVSTFVSIFLVTLIVPRVLGWMKKKGWVDNGRPRR